MFHTLARRALATFVAGAMAAGALIAVSQPAAAADGDPLQLGHLQVTPASGQIDSAAKTGWLDSAFTDGGQVCPAGQRGASELVVYIDDARVATTAAYAMLGGGSITPPSISGLDDGNTHIYRTGSYIVSPNAGIVFPWSTVAVTGGTVELRHTCEDAYGYDAATDPYYSVMIEVQPGGAWHVLGAPPAPVPYDSSESDVSFDLPPVGAPPSPATGLKISVKPGPVTLTGPATREPGQVWSATGTLGAVTVNDDRRDAALAGWTLNGRASDFTASGQDPLSAVHLGWTPVKVSGAGVAGAAVAPGVAGGLSVDQALATGTAADAENVATTVGATLQFDAPADVNPAGGAFTATLTLTLI
jgi:hypothetical protein